MLPGSRRLKTTTVHKKYNLIGMGFNHHKHNPKVLPSSFDYIDSLPYPKVLLGSFTIKVYT
jgi:hypothetical protein